MEEGSARIRYPLAFQKRDQAAASQDGRRRAGMIGDTTVVKIFAGANV
jgi:hypothetical protein